MKSHENLKSMKDQLKHVCFLQMHTNAYKCKVVLDNEL